MSGRSSASTIRPSEGDRNDPIDVSEDGHVMDDQDGDDDGNGTTSRSDIDQEVKEGDDEKFMCEPCGQGEGEPQKTVRSPGRPSPREVEDHELTHCPYRAWCEHCVKGQAKDDAHSAITGEMAESSVVRVIIDYCFFQEGLTGKATDHEVSTTAKSSLTTMVMLETLCHSVWAYAVESKGASETWTTEQILEDMETVGITNERIIMKADQEPSIIDVQRSVAKARSGYGTALENSKVGDSNSNGKIERCIQDFKGLVRTLRSDVESKINEKIDLEHPVVPWMIRHAAHLITKCRVRENGRTAYQLMKGRRSNAKMVPFAETVLFKIPKTQHKIGDFEDRWERGVWLGFIMKTGEHLVGTARGVFRVCTVMRRPSDKRWSAQLLRDIGGSPAEPVPGAVGRRIPAFAKKFEAESSEKAIFVPTKEVEPEVRVAFIYKSDVDEHGPTPRCPGCRAAAAGGKCRARHTDECRKRFEEILTQTEKGKKRFESATERRLDAITRKAMEMEPKEDDGDGVKETGMDTDGERKETNQAGAAAASGSGLNESDRRRSVDDQNKREIDAAKKESARETRRRKREVGDQGMGESEWGPHGQEAPMTPTRVPVPEMPPRADGPQGMEVNDGTALEEAPSKPRDIRVALERRALAAKRERAAAQAGDTPERQAKWMTVEGDDEVSAAEEDPRDKRATSPGVMGAMGEGQQEAKRGGAVEHGKHAMRTPSDEAKHAMRNPSVPSDEPQPGQNGPPGTNCESCGSTFPTRNALFRHLRAADAGTCGVTMDNVDSVAQSDPIEKSGKYRKVDLEWKHVGSGTFAKTFPQVTRFKTTSGNGPPQSEVFKRITHNLHTGQVIDECIVDDVPDDVLHRPLVQPTDIRVELVMKGAMRMFETKNVDIAEVFSPPRVAQEAVMSSYDGARLTPGWSLDLTREDPMTGQPWDLGKKEVRQRVRGLVRDTKPFLLIGSPPCTMFSSLQSLSKRQRDEEKYQKALRAAKEHVKFCLELYDMQMKAGRYFLHEHPHSASSWAMPEVLKMLMIDEVDVMVCDMCAFGMIIKDPDGEALARKRTRVMSNSPEVLKRLNKRCANAEAKDADAKHRHADTTCGRVKKCQVYPREFCRAICAGIAAQKKIRDLGLEAMPLMSTEEMMAAVPNEINTGNPSEDLHEENNFEELEAYDDVSGVKLDPKLMETARRDEIEYFKKRKVYEKVSVDECWRVTGKAPIAVRWVDINKGDEAHPNYRSRLVAKEYKTGVRPDLYAATPPSECLKLMISRLATDKGLRLMYADVSRAYFYARAVRPVYVKLPDEDRQEGDEGCCGKLLMSMYGTRDAAMNWSAEYTDTLIKDGYVQGKANPCLFRHPQKDVMIMVHGDDFVAVGRRKELTDTQATLENKYKIKVEVLGEGPGCQDEVRILNKIVRWTPEGIDLEADPRHAEIVVRDLGLESAKPSRVPGTKAAHVKKTVEDEDEKTKEILVLDAIEDVEAPLKSEGETSEAQKGGDGKVPGGDGDSEEELNPEEARKYRAIAARLNYIAADRPDIQYAVKEAARVMSRPRIKDWPLLNKIGRYLRGRPRLILRFPWQVLQSVVTGYTDSDWAGCSRTAKSTSGGIVTIGDHVIKTYSRQQKVIALSSAEAELYAMVAASAETLAIAAYAKDLGMELQGEIYTDSSAALGIAQRAGIGKIRHLRTQGLWVQEARVTGRIVYRKVLGSKNPADILTKHVPRDLLDRHLETLGAEVADGRAETAPELCSVESVVQWVEQRLPRHVRFALKVQFRAVESPNRGRRCSDRTVGRTAVERRGQRLREEPRKPRRWADIEENDHQETAEEVFRKK